MLILGINMLHPDSSAALVEDGKVLVAIAEERLNRKKHYAGIPYLAVHECLQHVGANLSDVAHIAIGRDTNANRAQKVKYALSHPGQLPQYVGLSRRGKRFANAKSAICEELGQDPRVFDHCVEHHVEHHLAHVASSFYCSGWDKAAALSYDGSGDFVSTMLADCQGTDIRLLKKVYVPHSLGFFYTTLCEFIGYRSYGDEGKVMGLAPYGTPALYPQVSEIIVETKDGYRLRSDYFLPWASAMRISEAQVTRKRRFGQLMIDVFGPPREPGTDLTQRDKDLAWAMQRRFEDVAFHLLRQLHGHVGGDRLVLAGGAALNSVTNGKLLTETPFRQTYIHPAAGDDGLAVGAALHAYHAILRRPREHRLTHASLGQEWSDSQIRSALDARNVDYQEVERGPQLERIAGRIAAGDVIGWFQGRMEWGPRALGNRSILAHPGLPNMKDVLNSRIKNREWYRPFAPSILQDRQADYFEHDHPSPFMLHVHRIRPHRRAELCAVNHADDTGRLQSVSRDENPLYYDLIAEFEKKTGTPVVLNTSFNENEPIVCQPSEAIDCYLRTKMDTLAIGPFVADKRPAPKGQPDNQGTE